MYVLMYVRMYVLVILILLLYLGIELVKSQNGYIGSCCATPAGAKLADGSTPHHAGQAGWSTGGKHRIYNRPPLDADLLCSIIDPATGMGCIKKRQSQVIKGKRYYKRYCPTGPLGSARKQRHDFRRKLGEPWP